MQPGGIRCIQTGKTIRNAAVEGGEESLKLHSEGTVGGARGPERHSVILGRRRLLAGGAAAAVVPLFGPLGLARGATRHDLSFRALWQGSPVGVHRVKFQVKGDTLTVDTHIDMTVKFMFFTVFRLKHEAREVWQSGRLVSVTSATDHDGTRLHVSGGAVENGFRLVGEKGPFLAGADLLTSNSLWDSRIVRESRLIDVLYGGEVGLVAKPLGYQQVDTPQGPVGTSAYQMITPHFAGKIFYDRDQRWVKALMEVKGEAIEYALAT